MFKKKGHLFFIAFGFELNFSKFETTIPLVVSLN